MYELQVVGISKRYAYKTVLDGVSLFLISGKVHSLLGENGAGKSTLAAIIAGHISSDSGQTFLNKNEVVINSPAAAQKLGIAMVEQHPKLSDQLPLWQNGILGTENKGLFGFIDKKQEVHSLEALCSQWGVQIDLHKTTKSAFLYERFYMGLFSALRTNPSLLILDEPSAVLDADLRRKFYNVLRERVHSGLSVLLITHSIEDALQHSDVISVLNKSKLIETLNTKDVHCTKEHIYSLLFASSNEPSKDSEELVVPKSVYKINTSNQISVNERDPVFTIKNVSVKPGLPDSLSFVAYAGEVTAVYGKGVVLQLFEDICTGMCKQKRAARLVIGKKELRCVTPRDLRKEGVALISSRKIFRSANPNITVYELLSSLKPYTRAQVQTLVDEQDVSINLDEKVSHLSGGMLQRLILARELAQKPQVLILCEPATGLDKKTELKLWNSLHEIALSGCAVIVLSSTIDNAKSSIDVFYELQKDSFRLIKDSIASRNNTDERQDENNE